ncbi:CLUMA_CG013829, isoform A [Clunio marinus]|uniref:CLUMA_CG013829, isoform A n=1 Tax=Clunio marinus TaxID=568069 RepID=A0A1J1IPZ0_9DIPT|nr:CLUMA_CG013829, isoform A [Clunio marinus]
MLRLQMFYSSYCGDFKFNVKYAKNCGDSEPVIKLINSSLTINEKCEITSQSCSEIKSYKTATKRLKQTDMMKLGFGFFGIPLTCSHKATPIFCYNGGTVINFTESKLRMLYTSQVFGKVAVFQVILTHDTGKSCFQAEIELNRNGED